jgi:hypothetical protein
VIVNINLLQKLKQKLRQEPILADIWRFYMDHFIDQPEFAKMGEPLRSEQLEAAIVNSCKQMFEDKGELLMAEFMSIYLDKYRFFHGRLRLKAAMVACSILRISRWVYSQSLVNHRW